MNTCEEVNPSETIGNIFARPSVDNYKKEMVDNFTGDEKRAAKGIRCLYSIGSTRGDGMII